MSSGKKLKPIFFKTLSILIMLGSFIFLQSCMQAPGNVRKSLLSSSNTTNGKTDTKLPTFKEGNNFIQNGGTVYTTTVNFDLSFSDTLQLRGKDVDSYIRSTGTQVMACLTARFTSVNQVNILAASPHSVYNFTTQTLEYYYSLAPSDDVTNKNFCQKSGLINKLYALYPLLTPTFKMSDLCPLGVCVSSLYTSSPLAIYSQGGTGVTQIGTTQLSYSITNKPNISTPIGQSCVTNSECTSLGYSCCNLGQCIKDLALKPGVDIASTNYVQALQDILNNPNHIYNYPQYYFLCSNDPGNITPTPIDNTAKAALVRLKNLTDLYNCTTKVEGELGFCTKTITNALIGTAYNAGIDDRNFSGTYTNQSSTGYAPTDKADLTSLQEITYGEVTLFNYDQTVNETTLRADPLIVSSYLTIFGQHNDDNASGASVTVTTKPASALSTDLVIRYRTDASCIQQNTNVGKCEKYYVQGQQKSGDTVIQSRRGRVTDHYPASNIFKLPYYANVNKTMTVEVDGVVQHNWQLNPGSPATIEFISSTGGLAVYDTQKVKITFFVDLTINHIMDSKLAALTKIKETCRCADLNCSISPVKNTQGNVTDYTCIYPDPNPVIPPDTQQVFLSSKTVPVRYFDSSGTSQATVTGSTLVQEATAFAYRKDNLLNPNNMPDIINPIDGENTYIGFNEIYGSLSYATNSAKPAKEVHITKGKIYDIYVDGGTYSNCIQCGNDYYSQLNKLFPLTQFAGGLTPLQARTDRSQSNGVRADDLSFGRACFVPATMLPFSHSIASDPKVQRQNRMRAQHFFYANGYQHDWYGFDYGSVIGSFDGVKWFSIGKNRRIKADTNKLFIAINGAFGDLALESTYTVTVNDGALNPVGTDMVTTDANSDGAECQKFHQCSTDNDCATTLGWDYACASINDITTSWPTFDDNAKEIPDASRDETLTNILSNAAAGKRCVYRGRGASCTQSYASSSNTNLQTLRSCGSNNYCQTIATGGVLNSKFNNRIARYGKVRSDPTSDSFGLAAKIIGRPMEFNAIEPIRSETAKNFNSNKVYGLCIPGRSPDVDTFVDQNSTLPSGEYLGDKVVGIGMTLKNATVPAANYLASCAIMDSTKNYFYAKSDPTTSNAANLDLIRSSATQAISTNALVKFKAILENTKQISFPLFKNNSGYLTAQTFTENRCMRAPGASCFSDIDCAPSKVIADKIKMLSADDSVVTAILNKYEVKFWQEELVCSQAVGKDKTEYSAFNNRCCRDVGKTISLPSSDATTPLLMNSAPGIDIGMDNKYRYSRVATVYKDQKSDATNYPSLQTAIADQCSGIGCVNTSVLTNQFKTFAAYAERTSCTGDWVRNFDNGNHVWSRSRLVQKFDPLMFRCMNWVPSSDNYSCSGYTQDEPGCSLVQTLPTSAKARAVMNFLAKLELMGILQIAVESEDYFNTTTIGDMSCLSDPLDQSNQLYPGGTTGTAAYKPPTQIYASTSPAREYFDATVSKQLYSAGDLTNFGSGFKKIFKADEVVTCNPAGTVMPVGASATLCCTGFINSSTNKCQLDDYVDISLYTNRYVSSEAKKLNSSLFDSNGYVKDPSYVSQLACEKSMCASGKIAFGVLVSQLKTPGQESLSPRPYRFIQGSSTADDIQGLLTQYNLGLKLNNHAYCLPVNVSANAAADLTIVTCGN
ncbi:MAG: hypothetical protein Q7U04_07505 [Bacteriovorax sp.]|nr:hypothetical protein [Bacteriovorax sp.]